MLLETPREISLAESRKICKKNGVGSLLTMPSGNSKLAKSKNWFNLGLTLAQGNLSGHETCPGRGACYEFTSRTGERVTPCLGNQGRAEHLPSITKSRIAKTRFLFTSPADFAACLLAELRAADRKSKRDGFEGVAFRPNVLSDLDWARMAPWLFDFFPAWAIYDYTKVKGRYRQYLNGNAPKNYHLTMSFSERLQDDSIREFLNQGGTIAVPFAIESVKNLPRTFLGFPVIDGVSSDLRFLDAPGSIVGLIAKTPKSKDAAQVFTKIVKESGFFVSAFDSRNQY